MIAIIVSGRKKKPAPPPPPALKSANSVNEIEKPSPVVASPPLHTTDPQVDVQKQEPESIKQNQGRWSSVVNKSDAGIFGRFKPFLEYRQLVLLRKTAVVEPMTLGQLYKNEIFTNNESETSSESGDNEIVDVCECNQRNNIMRSLFGCNNCVNREQDSFEAKLNAHARSCRAAPLPLTVLFDNRAGELV